MLLTIVTSGDLDMRDLLLTPFLAKTMSKNGKISDIDDFLPFFGQKEGQILFDLNSDARFEILSSFCISSAPFWFDFCILIF